MKYLVELNPTKDLRYMVKVKELNGDTVAIIALHQSRQGHYDVNLDTVFYNSQDLNIDQLVDLIRCCNNENMQKDKKTIFEIDLETLRASFKGYDEIDETSIEWGTLAGDFIPNELFMQQMRQRAEKRFTWLMNKTYEFTPYYYCNSQGKTVEFFDNISISQYPKSLLNYLQGNLIDEKATNLQKYAHHLLNPTSQETIEIERIFRGNNVNNELSYAECLNIIKDYIESKRFIDQEDILKEETVNSFMKKGTIPSALRMALNLTKTSEYSKRIKSFKKVLRKITR